MDQGSQSWRETCSLSDVLSSPQSICADCRVFYSTQIEPNFSLVYYNLALVYHRLNNVPAATQSLTRYKELEPSDEEIELVDQLLKAMETGRPGG